MTKPIHENLKNQWSSVQNFSSPLKVNMWLAEGCLINQSCWAWQLRASTSVFHLWKSLAPGASEDGVRRYMAADANHGPVTRADTQQESWLGAQLLWPVSSGDPSSLLRTLSYLSQASKWLNSCYISLYSFYINTHDPVVFCYTREFSSVCVCPSEQKQRFSILQRQKHRGWYRYTF